VTVEAKSWIEGTPHSWGWIDFLDARPLEMSKRGRIASFCGRRRQLPVTEAGDIYIAHTKGHRDMARCEGRIRILSNAVCKLNHTTRRTLLVYSISEEDTIT
jgi:hypothetical protein